MKSLLLTLLALPLELSLASNNAQHPLISTPKKHSLTHDLIAFHKNLTQIPSVSGNESAIGHWLANSLSEQGYNVEKQYISHEPERFNVLAWPGEVRNAPVLLTSHIDTVPPFLPYTHSNSTISGRGSVDAKASIATQILALNHLLSHQKIHADNISVLYVVGEEVGGSGMRAANSLSLTPKTILFGEPTEGKLVSGHKGNLRVGLSAKGKAGHSGYPWLGRSANEVLVRALNAVIGLGDSLPKNDKFGVTTFNLGTLEGGVAGNVIAESASADIAVRIAEGSPSSIKKAVTKAVNLAIQEFLEDGRLKPQEVLELDFGSKGYGPIEVDHDVPGFESMTVNYGTDIPWLEVGEGVKRYLYGPGSIFVAHSADEKLEERDLWAGKEGVERIILFALGK